MVLFGPFLIGMLMLSAGVFADSILESTHLIYWNGSAITDAIIITCNETGRPGKTITIDENFIKSQMEGINKNFNGANTDMMKAIRQLGLCSAIDNNLASQHKYRFDYVWNEATSGWLKYHRIPAVWEEARLRCLAEGAVLVSPLDDKLKEAINEYARKNNAINLYIGVHCSFSKGDYSSIEGVPLERLPIDWALGEPNNLDNAENCLTMTFDESHNGTVADTRCDNVFTYICHKKFEPLTMTECGTLDREYVFSVLTENCYKFHKQLLPWGEAYRTCRGEGGYLAIIDNVAEMSAVRNIIGNRNTGRDTNIGYHNWDHYGSNFMTIHGDLFDDKNYQWISDEPSNFSFTRRNDLGEFCGSLSPNWQLNDNPCHLPCPFLCEKNPKSLL